jgi:hypothetical protein
VVDGLKLTMTGEEIRALLAERIECHQRGAERWKTERARTPEDYSDEQPLMPDHICENEAERHAWRIEVLEFIRDHIAPLEVYYLGAADLEFGELMPEKPGWMEQDEYERENAVAFNLDRLRRELRWSRFSDYDVAHAAAADENAGGASAEQD